MSSVNFLEKLLGGAEIEWRTLGDITKKWYSGGTPTAGKAEYYENGTIPWLRTQEVKFNDIHETEVNITKTALEKTSAKWIPENCVIIAISGATAGRSAINKIPLTTNQHCGCLEIYKEVALYRYVFHWVCFNYENIRSLGQGARGDLNSTIIKNFRIPIPCPDNPKKSLEIQAEIVRILDAMTAHTAELTAELTARKKQYNYYRDKLLSFEDGEVEWKKLGEVADIQRGASPRPIANYMTDDENGVPWIKIGDTVPGSKYVDRTEQKVTHEGANKSRILNPGDFIMSNSMSFGRPYILNIRGAIHDGWAAISNFNSILDTDYLYHYLSSDFVKKYWESKINSGSVSNLNADIIKSLPIPIPEIQKQKQIAALLDKFDALTASITDGLPREIELREKQYAYYRDLLLSFPKPPTI